MDSQEPHLILQGERRRFVIGADFWAEIVSWAAAQGWIAGSLDGDWRDGREFSDEESARLAEALDVIGGNLILHSGGNVPEEFITRLAEALQTLQTFAASGGFRVMPLD